MYFFISGAESVYSAVRTESLQKADHVSYLKCIRTVPRPATRKQVFLVFLYLQANAEMTPQDSKLLLRVSPAALPFQIYQNLSPCFKVKISKLGF
jgi:hypothetical protein